MADFIHFEAEVSGSDSSENENDNDLDEMKSFINDDSESDNEIDENFQFVNSEIDIDEANQRIEQEALARIFLTRLMKMSLHFLNFQILKII